MQGNVIISVWLEDSKLSWLTLEGKLQTKLGSNIRAEYEGLEAIYFIYSKGHIKH